MSKLCDPFSHSESALIGAFLYGQRPSQPNYDQNSFFVIRHRVYQWLLGNLFICLPPLEFRKRAGPRASPLPQPQPSTRAHSKKVRKFLDTNAESIFPPDLYVLFRGRKGLCFFGPARIFLRQFLIVVLTLVNLVTLPVEAKKFFRNTC